MVKLKSLHLENIQSWEDATIEFGPGLNAIIANNNVGKSVVFKTLKITCNPEFFAKPERAKLVRYGKDFGRATYTFSDGSVAVVTITEKKVMYHFTDANGDEFSSEEVPLNQILRNLSVVMEDNSRYLVNVLDSEQSLLLVKSDKKANSDLLKVITEHKDIERLTKLFKEKVSEYGGVSSDTSFLQKKIKTQLDSLEIKDIDMLEDQVNHLDVMYEELDLLENLYLHSKSINEANKNISGIDWGIFGNMLSNVNYVECQDYFGWGGFIELLTALPKEHLECRDDAPDWSLITALLNQSPNVNLTEIPDLTCLDTIIKMQEQCAKIIDIQKQSQEAQNEIARLKAIDFNGTVYDCPVHGKIVYNNGKCEVSNDR